MGTMTSKYDITHSDVEKTIELIKDAVDKGWNVVKISINSGDGFNVYKVDFEKTEMG